MTSWKSSLAGIAAAVLNLIANGTSVKNALFSGAIALLGIMAKDFNVSGGAPTQKQ